MTDTILRIGFEGARRAAAMSGCSRDRCGSVLMDESRNPVFFGFNYPAGRAKCTLDLRVSPKPKSDRTCCLHAEWVTVMSLLRSRDDASRFTLFFTRVDTDGRRLHSGKPYCTVCSRLILASGISSVALWHESGPRVYSADEYNELSYQFHMEADHD